MSRMMFASDAQCICGHPWGEHCRYGCTAYVAKTPTWEDVCPCTHFAVPPAAVEMARAGATQLPGLEV